MSNLRTGGLVLNLEHVMNGIHVCSVCKGKGTISVYWVKEYGVVPPPEEILHLECPIKLIDRHGFQAADDILVKLIQMNGPTDVIADVAVARDRMKSTEDILALPNPNEGRPVGLDPA